MQWACKGLLAWGRQAGPARRLLGCTDPEPQPRRAPVARRRQKGRHTIQDRSSPLPRLWSQPSLMTDTSFMVAA